MPVLGVLSIRIFAKKSLTVDPYYELAIAVYDMSDNRQDIFSSLILAMLTQ